MSEFEPILLKKLISHGLFFGKALPILKKKYFTSPGYQELFQIIQDYYTKFKGIPSSTELMAKVKDVPNNNVREDIVKCLGIINVTDEVKNVDFILEETVSWVKDAMYLEALQIGSDGLMKRDDTLKLKAQEILDERSKVTIDSDLGLDFDDIDQMIDYYSEKMLGIRTHHNEFNKRLGSGFLPGTLSVILAAAGVGKSLLMTDLISGMVKNNKKILLISLEMSDRELMKRVHANAMDLPINTLIDLSKTPGELEGLGREPTTKEMVVAAHNRLKASGTCGQLFIKDYPAGSFSALMLEQLVESYKIERGIEFDIIFIDYIGIMKSDRVSPSVGLYSYVKSIGEEVRASAKKLAIPIVSASQLNRAATNTDNADNSNVSDSIGTVMTADFMIFLLQNEEMKAKCEMVCKVTKNRFNGRTDTWSMNIDYTRMRFIEMLVHGAGTVLQNITEPEIVSSVDEPFEVLTAKKQEDAKIFADQEVKDILREDIEKIKNTDPFVDDMDDLFKELGIDE